MVNDNKPEDGKFPQFIRCYLCYKTPLLYNPRTKLRKGLISYYKTNEILTLKKHVDVKHNLLAKKLDEEMNHSKKSQVENQLCRNPTLKDVRMTLTLPKWGLGSPLELPKTQSSIAGVKTPHLEIFFTLLESSRSLNVENGLA